MGRPELPPPHHTAETGHQIPKTAAISKAARGHKTSATNTSAARTPSGAEVSASAPARTSSGAEVPASAAGTPARTRTGTAETPKQVPGQIQGTVARQIVSEKT